MIRRGGDSKQPCVCVNTWRQHHRGGGGHHAGGQDQGRGRSAPSQGRGGGGGSGLYPQLICSQVREKRKLGHHVFLLSKITFSLLFYLDAMSSSAEVCKLVNSWRANSSDSVQFTQCISCAHLTSVRMLTISTLWHTGVFPSSHTPPPPTPCPPPPDMNFKVWKFRK